MTYPINMINSNECIKNTLGINYSQNAQIGYLMFSLWEEKGYPSPKDDTWEDFGNCIQKEIFKLK